MPVHSTKSDRKVILTYYFYSNYLKTKLTVFCKYTTSGIPQISLFSNLAAKHEACLQERTGGNPRFYVGEAGLRPTPGSQATEPNPSYDVVLIVTRNCALVLVSVERKWSLCTEHVQQVPIPGYSCWTLAWASSVWTHTTAYDVVFGYPIKKQSGNPLRPLIFPAADKNCNFSKQKYIRRAKYNARKSYKNVLVKCCRKGTQSAKSQQSKLAKIIF